MSDEAIRAGLAGGWAPKYLNMLINREIIDCSSAHAILSMFDTRVVEFNEVNLVTALHRLGKSPDGHRALRDKRFGNLIDELRQ